VPTRYSLALWTFVITLAGSIACFQTGPAFSEPSALDPLIDSLSERAKPPAIETPAAEDALNLKQRRIFQATLSTEPRLLLRLQDLFAPYFDQPVDLTALLQKIVAESAVLSVPHVGRILYNPGHMLLLLIPENWQETEGIRVAALADLLDILKIEIPGALQLAAYGRGFEAFKLLSELMKDAKARATLEVVWNAAPRSSQDAERMRYLLLRPMQQAMEIARETPACRQAINRFIDDVRAGKRASIPASRGLTDIVKPTRFIRSDNQILLVLSETFIARYYVVAQFSVGAESCDVAWENAIFAM